MTAAGLERFGPFFALDRLGTSDLAGSGWVPISDLWTDPGRLSARIDATQAALAGLGPNRLRPDAARRVATSITHLGLCARLVSVALALEVEGVAAPAVSALVFQDTLGGPYPLGTVEPAGIGSRWPTTVGAWTDRISEAATTVHGLSSRIARGNIASALAGATAMVVRSDPAAGVRARASCDRALAQSELVGTGAWRGDGGFRRASCCLIYRLAAEPVLCGDCVLAGRAESGVSRRSASGAKTNPIVPQSSS